MFCIQCGSALAENARFCAKCGTAVTPVTTNGPTVGPAGQAAPIYGQPVYPCFFYPVNAVMAPGTMPAAQAPEQPDPTPIYRRKKQPSEYDAPNAWDAHCPDTAFDEYDEDIDEPFMEEALAPQDEPLTVWQTVCCLLALLCLPVGNIIFACVWGFRADEHPQRRTLARAALPFIAFGLTVLFVALLWLTVNFNGVSITLR